MPDVRDHIFIGVAVISLLAFLFAISDTTTFKDITVSDTITAEAITVETLNNLVPHIIVSSSEDQLILSTNKTQKINYTDLEDNNKMWYNSSGNIFVNESGEYLITISAIVKSGLANKYIEIWIRHNEVPVNRSNTRIQIPNANTEMILAVTYILDMDKGDNFALMMWGDSTTNQLQATAAATTPVRPASPSIIVSANKIGAVND
jgi:hypothetical protein